MKVTLVIAALFAVCSSSFGQDWMRTNNLDEDQQHGSEHYDKRQRHTADRRCPSQADVVFILDRSRSIYPPDFEKGKEFLQDVVRLFNPSISRFAAISFAEGATVEFGLNTYGRDQQAETLRAIKNIDQRPGVGGQTNTWAALEKVYREVLSRRNRQPGVTPTVLLLTDGSSHQSDRTANEARKARSYGIRIFAIGVGNGARMSELNAIASNSNHVHMVADYSQALHAIRTTVATEICRFPQH